MPYFRVMIHGEGIDVPSIDGSKSIIGFYSTRLVKARSAPEADATVRTLILSDWTSGSYAPANRGVPPSLRVESIIKTTVFDWLRFRNAGYTFYSRDENAAA
jgi:hypothetical protein